MAVESNRLLKMLAAGVGVVALVVALKAMNSDPAPVQADPGAPRDNGMGNGAISQDELAAMGGASADTPDDKVSTLVAEVRAARREVDEVRKRNELLLKENSDLKGLEGRVEERIQARFVNKEQQMEQEKQEVARQRQDADRLLGALQEQIGQLTNGKLGRSAGGGATRGTGGADIPVGLGLDPAAAAATGGEPVVWVDPLDMPAKDLNGKRPAFPAAIEQGLAEVGGGVSHATSGVVKSAKPKPDKPVFTINRDATLVGSVSMTALIGRVPVGGTVSDPYPFKLLVGSDNLAANGITIPGLDSMVVSGSATGDWGLSCVRGTITSATFVFRDGTIRSYPMPERGKNGSGGGSGGSQQKRAFGYISDTFGTPCVTGERKSNAVQYLSTRVGLAAAQAWAEAEAAAETTQIVSGETGTITNAVTGNSGQFAKNKAISSGIEESSNWVKERQAQSFDAIFVRNGTEVAIHIDEEISIDYEAKGRKVDHHATLSFDANPNRHALP